MAIAVTSNISVSMLFLIYLVEFSNKFQRYFRLFSFAFQIISCAFQSTTANPFGVCCAKHCTHLTHFLHAIFPSLQISIIRFGFVLLIGCKCAKRVFWIFCAPALHDFPFVLFSFLFFFTHSNDIFMRFGFNFKIGFLIIGHWNR